MWLWLKNVGVFIICVWKIGAATTINNITHIARRALLAKYF